MVRAEQRNKPNGRTGLQNTKRGKKVTFERPHAPEREHSHKQRKKKASQRKESATSGPISQKRKKKARTPPHKPVVEWGHDSKRKSQKS